jgi:tRNA U34 5-methylaminomethyl-2-thiouridine-forming methyltransferase MnmC
LKNSSYRFFETADGSPTVFFTNADGVEEAMHSYHGAFSETDYIYGEGMRQLRELNGPYRCLSLGLGLGYVEMLAAALLPEMQLVTFEKQPELIERFQAWLEDGALEPQWQQTYDAIATLVSAPMNEIKERLLSDQWQVYGAIEDQVDQIPAQLNLICYDAYSKKASPELWQEELLSEILQRAANPCVFTTYSSNGALKRALRAAEFELKERSGFAGKRESTLALRL